MKLNTDNIIKRLIAFDLDTTIFDTPTPKEGKKIWEKYYNKPFPYKDWWGSPESLDLNIFDIKPFPSVLNQLKDEQSKPNTLLIILTSRNEELRPQVEKVLNKNNIHVDGIDMKDDKTTKGQKILNYIRMYPDLVEVNVYEDRDIEIETYENIKNQIPKEITFNIYRVINGNIMLTESKLLKIINEEIQKLI